MSDHNATPKWLLRLFDGWDDPCPLNGSGGLEREWGDWVYVNPPFSDISPWVAKAIEASRRGKLVVMLVPHDPSTRWWQDLRTSGGHILAPLERLCFGDHTGSLRTPIDLVVMHHEAEVLYGVPL